MLVRDIAEFEERWDEAVEALQRAIDLLRHPQEFGAISSQYLPYVSILPVFAALQFAAKHLPPIRQLTHSARSATGIGPASSPTDTQGRSSRRAPATISMSRPGLKTTRPSPRSSPSFATRFKGLDLRRETKRGTSVYNGIFNLLVLRGARDWMTGNGAQYGDLDDHHIVPKSWGKAARPRQRLSTPSSTGRH